MSNAGPVERLSGGPVDGTTPPLATVVIPAYNREAYIGEAIASALKQQTTYPYEVIVSDDCSTDGTVAVARSYGDRVRVLEAVRNSGPSATRNRAIAAARGRYIVMLDDDDHMYPDRIQVQVAFLEQHPEVDLAVGLLDGGTVPPEQYFASKGIEVPWGSWKIIGEWRSILLERFIGTPSSCVYRTSLFDRAGGFDEGVRFGDDVELLLRATRHTSLACYNGRIGWQRSHPGRMTSSSRWSAGLADLLARFLASTGDLTEAERRDLAAKRGNHARAALGTALHDGDMPQVRRIVDAHGDSLAPAARIKWTVISRVPPPVAATMLSVRQGAAR